MDSQGGGSCGGDFRVTWCLLCPTFSQHLHKRQCGWLFPRMSGHCGYWDLVAGWANSPGHQHPEAHQPQAYLWWQGEGSCHSIPPGLPPHLGSPGPTCLPLCLAASAFMWCHRKPAYAPPHHQWHHLHCAPLLLRPAGEGAMQGAGSQIGACKNPWAAAGRRVPSAGLVTPLQMLLSPCGWASASHKTNHVRVKGSLGHPSSWNKRGDTTPCWHDAWHKERGTLRASASQSLNSISALRCMNMESQF